MTPVNCQLEFRKIANGEGGLLADTIPPNGQFGSSATGLGDLDEDGIPDALVGAPLEGTARK